MESNPQLELAQDFINKTSCNLFLTGKAGTGKTTFLKNIRRSSYKRIIVVAPTGIAAINAGGVTIHSFFQLPFSPFIPTQTQPKSINKFSKEKINIIRSIDTLVIDEISMVRSDLLDAVDSVLRKYRNSHLPFGGVQLVMIGDVQQLSPVIKDDEWNMLSAYYSSPFFFHSSALMKTGYVSIELKKIYRQSDSNFVKVLNAIRNKNITSDILDQLNSRLDKNFINNENEGYITLTTHNSQANIINLNKIEALENPKFTFEATVEGDFPQYSFPTDENLILKKGAQVMFIKNDPSPEKKYYNGKIGIISQINKDMITVESEGDLIAVSPLEWENTKYSLDPETNEIKEKVEGKFRQFPLRTAWAITVHKSQGLTFDKVIINVSQAFTHGQVYVALSRCRTLEGIVLLESINESLLKKDIIIDEFNEYVSRNEPSSEILELAHQKFFMELLIELFDFRKLINILKNYTRICEEHLRMLYPSLVEQLKQTVSISDEEILSVGNKFIAQLQGYVATIPDYETNDVIIDRIKKGSTYFLDKLNSVSGKIGSSAPQIDNKELLKVLTREYENLINELSLKISCLTSSQSGFKIDLHLKSKAMSSIISEKRKVTKAKKEREAAIIESNNDINNILLYSRLRTWRKNKSEELNIPAYTIFQQKALIGLTNKMPASEKELLAISGIGKKIAEKFGDEILSIIDDYKKDKNIK